MTAPFEGSGWFCRAHPGVRLDRVGRRWVHRDRGFCSAAFPVFRSVCSGCGSVERPGAQLFSVARLVDGSVRCVACGHHRLLPPVVAGVFGG